MEDKLDDNWIIDFENKDKLYQDFYKDDNYFTNINFIYVNQENEIEKIISENFIMSTPNYITREEIIGILKKKSFNCENNKKYTLLSLLKYNISLNVEDVTTFLKVNSYSDDFLISLSDITLSSTQSNGSVTGATVAFDILESTNNNTTTESILTSLFI